MPVYVNPDVHNATKKLEEYLLGEDTQTFWSTLGAVVITDNEVYEVYSYDEGVIVQSRDLDRADGWREITGNVLKEK